MREARMKRRMTIKGRRRRNKLLRLWRCGMFPFHGFLFALRVIMIKPGFITGNNPKMKIIWVGVVPS